MIGAAPPARERAQQRRREGLVERLDAQRGRRRTPRARRRRRRAGRCRSGADRRTAGAAPPSSVIRHARVRRLLRRVEQQRAGHPQVHQQVDLARRAPSRGTCRGGAAPRTRRPTTASRERRRRERRAPARVEDLERGDRRAARAPARAGGGSSRPRAAQASAMNERPGSGARGRRPASRAPRRRRRRAGRRGGARRGRRSAPAAARTRACGRCAPPPGRSRGRR